MSKTAIRLICCLLIAVAFKAYVSFHYAPRLSGDMRAYVQLAQDITANAAWLTNSPVLEKDSAGRYVWHVSHRRMLGYPAFLSFLMTHFADDWRTALSLIASAGTILCGLLIFLVVHRWTNGASMLPEIGFFAPIFSQRLFWDIVPMTDSLNSTVFTCAIATLLLAPNRGNTRHLWAFASGVLAGCAFLLRDPTAYFYFICIPLLLVKFVGDRRKRWLNGAIALLLFVLPLQVAKYSYEFWNWQRTGKAFVTTAARSNFGVSLGGIYQIDRNVLSEDGVVGKTAIETGRELEGRTFDHPNLAIWEFSRLYNEKLWNDARLDALTASRMTTSYVAKLALTHPILALRRMIMGGLVDDYHVRQFYDAYKFWPFLEQDNLLRPAGGDYVDSMLIGGVLVDAAKQVQRILSVLLGLGFFVGIPCALAMTMRRTLSVLSAEKALLMGGVLLFYLAIDASHSLVNMEFRFMLVALPMSTAMSLVALWALFRRATQGESRVGDLWRRVTRKS